MRELEWHAAGAGSGSCFVRELERAGATVSESANEAPASGLAASTPEMPRSWPLWRKLPLLTGGEKGIAIMLATRLGGLAWNGGPLADMLATLNLAI